MSQIFSDVTSDTPFSEAIAAAVGMGIMNGFSDGTFRPGEGMVGQDFGVLLGRAIAGEPVPPELISAILDNPVLLQEADRPVDRLRAVIATVNALDEIRPGLIPDLPGVLEHLRTLLGETREVPRARDAELLAGLMDYWNEQIAQNRQLTLLQPLMEYLDEPMSRAEMARLLVNVTRLLEREQAVA